jgi:hypothetical protein
MLTKRKEIIIIVEFISFPDSSQIAGSGRLNLTRTPSDLHVKV